LSDPIRAVLRPFVHALRSLRDRTLHPFRRKRAQRIVAAIPEIRSILFLCTGNICRSPYAEKALPRILGLSGDGPLPGEGALSGASSGASPEARQRDASGGPIIASGGFLASGRPSPPEAVRIAGERGILLEDHRSRTVDAEMLDGVDLVVVMERAHEKKLKQSPGGETVPVILLGDLDPEAPRQREIRDPWGQEDAVFHESFDRIERCLPVIGLGGGERFVL